MDAERRITVSLPDGRSAEYRFAGDTPGSHSGVGVAVEPETIEFNVKGR